MRALVWDFAYQDILLQFEARDGMVYLLVREDEYGFPVEAAKRLLWELRDALEELEGKAEEPA